MGKNPDPGWIKIRIRDEQAGSYFAIFWVKIFKIFNADLGSGMEKIRIREKHP
jgi:hypothetical protein